MKNEGKMRKEEIKEKRGWSSVVPMFMIISLITIFMLSYALYSERSSGKESLKQTSENVGNTQTAGNAQNTAALSPGCKDTDGDNLDELGVVYLTKDNKRIKYVDKCLDKHTVKEYFCAGADAKAKIYKCASVCTICREEASAAAEEKPVTESSEYTEEQKTEDNESLKQTEEENQQDLEEVKDNRKYYYNCKNGFKDTFETDVDCGGSECSGCGYNKRCELNQDCTTGLKCNQRLKRCMQ